jgi:hypothetical protein
LLCVLNIHNFGLKAVKIQSLKVIVSVNFCDVSKGVF